jgi:hypothetical protein
MVKKRNYQCLMVETRDKRKFFTYEKNYPLLIEFANAFNAEVSTVQIKEGEILDLAPLASAISNPDYIAKPKFEKIETKIPKLKKRPRKRAMEIAQIIRNHIREKLMSEEVVGLREIKNRYKRYNLTSSCFCAHLSKVRDELEREGHVIEKMGGGKYMLK